MTIETARETAATFFNQLDDAQAQLKAAQAELATMKELLEASNQANANLQHRFDAFMGSATDTRAYIEGLLDIEKKRADKYQALTISLAKGSQLFGTLVTAAMADLHNQAAKALVVEPATPEQEQSTEDALDAGIANIAKNFGAGFDTTTPGVNEVHAQTSPTPPQPVAPPPPVIPANSYLANSTY